MINRLYKKSSNRLSRNPQIRGNGFSTSLCGCPHYPPAAENAAVDEVDEGLSTVWIKTAIFDLDGTLLDTNGIWKTLGEKFLLSIGKIPAPDLSERLWDMSLKDAAKLLKAEYSLDLSQEEIIEKAVKMSEDFYLYEAKPKNGAREILERFKKLNVQIKLVTSSDENLAEKSLKRLDMLQYFDEIYGKADKSKKNAYLNACDKPNEAVVFEDALYAVKTAKSAGFTVCAVYDFSEKDKETLKMTADFYEKELSDYIEKIDRILKGK